jgi:Tol biopolymer transport system component
MLVFAALANCRKWNNYAIGQQRCSNCDPLIKMKETPMDRRRFLGNLSAGVWLAQSASTAFAQTLPKETLLLNRIGPTASQIFIADADGSNERKLIDSGTLDYNASFSADGQWVVFTSERDGLGNSNVYRARVDGTQVERLTDSPAVDDAAVISPDGSKVAFVSTRDGFLANIWVLDLETRKLCQGRARAC